MKKTAVRIALLLSIALISSAFIKADTFTEKFNKPLVDTHLWNLYPKWSLTAENTLKAGDAENVKNQYLLPVNEWNLDEFITILKTTHTDKPGSNLTIMFSSENGGWLNIRIIKDGVAVSIRKGGEKKTENLPFISFKKLEGKADEMSQWKIVFPEKKCEIYFKDKEVVKVDDANFTGRIGWRIITYHCEPEIDEITLKGIEYNKRLSIIGTPLSEKNYEEKVRDRFYADGVTEINTPKKGIDVSKGNKLKPQKSWWFGKPDGKWDEFTLDQKNFVGKKEADILIGIDKPENLLWRLRSFKRKNAPETFRFFFKVPENGIYTIKAYFGGAKNLANIIHCSIDGHRLMTDVIRGSNPQYLHSMYREHFPVKLKSGAHVFTMTIEPRQSFQVSYMHGVALDAVGLEAGNVPLVYEDSAAGERPLNEIITAVQSKRTIGRNFHYRISNVAEQKLQIELTFHQPVTNAAGFAVFDVSSNGNVLLKDFDIAAQNGSNQPITRAVKTESIDGVVDLHFKASKGRALVNRIRLLDMKGRKFAEINCGVSPDRNYGFMGPADVRTKWKDSYGKYKPFLNAEYPDFLRHLGKNLYDGPVNIVVDPGFEISKDKNECWRPISGAAPSNSRSEITGSGSYELDNKIRHSGKRSLKISATKGTWGIQGNQTLVDWTRPYKFSAWVKAKDVTGESCLEIIWSKADGKVLKHGRWEYDGHGSGLSRGGVRPVDSAKSSKLNGTFNWKQISLRTYPPKGTSVAAFRIRSDNNNGEIWFDDLKCEGYGDLPVEIIASQLGYHTGGQKEVVVLTQNELKAKDFYLVNADTGKTAYKGKLQNGKKYQMVDRFAYHADFSAVKEKGKFLVTLDEKDKNSVQSGKFKIADNIYVDLLRSNAFYFYTMREGMEIPGYHKASHLDDALVASPFFDRMDRIEGFKDLTGGWIDAGDFGKFNLRVFQPVFCLSEALQKSGLVLNNYKRPFNDIMDEVIWGADYLAKCDIGNGLLHGKVNGGFMGGFPGMPPSLETDQNPMTVDGYGRTAAWTTGEDVAAALAMVRAALSVRDADPGRGFKYLKLAEKNYFNCSAYWDDLVNDEMPSWKQLVFQPRALWTACLLYKATGNPDYQKDAVKRLSILLPLIKKDIYKSDAYYWGRQRTIKGNNFPWDYLHALMSFAEVFNNHKLTLETRSETERVIDTYVMKFNRRNSNPFGAVENIMAENLWYYPEANYTTEFFPKTAWVLARAGNMFDKKEWLTAAERNLQWMIGMNHLNGSYISGYGDRQFALWSGLLNVPGLRRGILPGSITKGFSWETGQILWGNRHRPNGYGGPRGYAMVSIHDGEGWYPHAPTAGIEIWEQFNGGVLAACAELNNAYSPNEKGEDLPPLPVGTYNLLKNSGFEKLTDTKLLNSKRPKWKVKGNRVPADWDFNGDQAGILEVVEDKSDPRLGKYTLKIEKPDNYRSAALITGRPFLPAKPGETYWLSLWLKGEGKVTPFALEYNKGKYLYARDLAYYRLDSEWRRLDLEYTVSEKSGPNKETVDALRFSFHLIPKSVMYIDNIELRKSPDIEIPQPQRLK
ncbi:MAG: glycoside hydrolase family 9 protein [Planctomycetota bacterium]